MKLCGLCDLILILVGGMAIDYNLRLRGLKLYDDNTIPDYDFYSPKNAEDAYQLASELCNDKFAEVDVISAIHVTTMKVRVGGHVVADITYVPETLFEKIRTQTYKNMRIIFPYYTEMDQMRSLSCPYENPPHEVITDRWHKDVKRFNTLATAYPFDRDPEMTPDVKISLHTVQIPDPVYKKKGVVNGWAALAYYQQKYSVENPRLRLSYDSKKKTAEIPTKYITIMTQEWQSWLSAKKDKTTKFYNSSFAYFRRAATPILELYDTWGEQITVSGDDTEIASVCSVFYYFLYRYLFSTDKEDKKIALIGLRSTSDLFELGYVEKLDVDVYGDEIWNKSTLYNVANHMHPSQARTWKPPNQPFPQTDCTVKKTFDAKQSPLFELDESECEPWNDIVERKLLMIECNQ